MGIGLLTSLLPFAIRFSERLITRPKSGSDRKAMVRDMARAALEKVSAVEGAGAPKPTDPEIDGAIEVVFQQLQASGALAANADDEQQFLLLIHGRYEIIPVKK